MTDVEEGVRILAECRRTGGPGSLVACGGQEADRIAALQYVRHYQALLAAMSWHAHEKLRAELLSIPWAEMARPPSAETAEAIKASRALAPFLAAFDPGREIAVLFVGADFRVFVWGATNPAPPLALRRLGN